MSDKVMNPEIESSSAKATEDSLPSVASAKEGYTLIFRLGGERFGLPLAVVKEVVELLEPPTAIPGAPSWVAGMMNHHGQVVVLVRMGVLMERASQGDSRQLILIEMAGERVGLVVDSIESLEKIAIEGTASVPTGDQDHARIWHRGAFLQMFAEPDLVELLVRYTG